MSRARQGDVTYIPCPDLVRRLHFLDEVTSRDGLPLEFWGFRATPSITYSLLSREKHLGKA